jgi:7-cyano-7-deazaguanine synthase
MGKKCVVLLSGGIDSSVLLYSLVSQYECYPISFDYGQTHVKELIAARNVCEARNHDLLLRHRVVNLSSALGGLLPSALTGKGKIPEGHYAAKNMKLTVVPGRNLIMLAIAAGYAEGMSASAVAYAAHAEDHFIYPDCRPEFVATAAQVIHRSTEFGVSLLAPFLNMSKSEIITLGKRLTVPFRRTWSCYKGGDLHCGKCGTCVERKEAFAKAGVEDPTEYE